MSKSHQWDRKSDLYPYNGYIYVCSKCGVERNKESYRNLPDNRTIHLKAGEPDCDQTIVERVMDT